MSTVTTTASNGWTVGKVVAVMLISAATAVGVIWYERWARPSPGPTPPAPVKPAVYASLVGPATVKVGELVTLDASGSTGSQFRYVPGDGSVTVKGIGNQANAVFRTAGKHIVTLTVAGVVNGAAVLADDVLTVTVEDGSNPGPSPTPGPTPVGPVPPAPSTEFGSIAATAHRQQLAAESAAWRGASAKLAAGGKLADAIPALNTEVDAARKAAFAQAASAFAKLVPSGGEPADATQRAAVVKAFNDYAAGITGP